MTNFNGDYTMTIGGRPAKSGTTFKAFNPATGQAIAEVPDASEAQLNEAVAAAREAFPAWSQLPLAGRQAALWAVAQVIEENAQALMALLTKEQGKPRSGAEWEILGSALWCREAATQSLPE